MKHSRIISIVLTFALVAMMCIPFGAMADEDTIKIGNIAPETGDVAVYGLAVLNGVQLYINELNAAGGINGKQVELIHYDDKGDATEAMNAYNKLIYSDVVDALIGPVTSTPTFGVAEASVYDNVPGITATATHPDVTTYGSNYFRACFEDPFQGGTICSFAAKELGAKTAAIIYNNGDSYSIGLEASFIERAAEEGLEIVASEAYAKGDVDFKAQLTNIIEKNPDVLFLPDYYNNVYMICSQARDLGYTGTFIGVDGADGLLEIEGADASILEGMYFPNHYSTQSDSEITQAFIKAYTETYDAAPNAFAALAYDAAKILCNAIKNAEDAGAVINGEESYQAIIDALAATDIVGATGPITFDENNNPIKEVCIIQITNGEYIFWGNY